MKTRCSVYEVPLKENPNIQDQYLLSNTKVLPYIKQKIKLAINSRGHNSFTLFFYPFQSYLFLATQCLGFAFMIHIFIWRSAVSHTGV